MPIIGPATLVSDEGVELLVGVAARLTCPCGDAGGYSMYMSVFEYFPWIIETTVDNP